MMGTIKALKCFQNLYKVVVCPCPGAFFKWWPWVDRDHFYDRVRFVSWCFCIGDSLYLYFQVCTNSAYPQHTGERYRTNGPLVTYFSEMLTADPYVRGCLVEVNQGRFWSSSWEILCKSQKPLRRQSTIHTCWWNQIFVCDQSDLNSCSKGVSLVVRQTWLLTELSGCRSFCLTLTGISASCISKVTCMCSFDVSMVLLLVVYELSSIYGTYKKSLSAWPASVEASVRFVSFGIILFEQPHYRTNKMMSLHSEDSGQPGHPPSLIRVFAAHMKNPLVLSYPLSAQQRLWSAWASGWTESSLGAQVILLVLSCGGSFVFQWSQIAFMYTCVYIFVSWFVFILCSIMLVAFLKFKSQIKYLMQE